MKHEQDYPNRAYGFGLSYQDYRPVKRKSRNPYDWYGEHAKHKREFYYGKPKRKTSKGKIPKNVAKIAVTVVHELPDF